MKKQNISLLMAFIFLLIISSCTDNNDSIKEASKYEDTYNWASLPLSITKTVDVFYAYPTIYLDAEPPSMDISNTKNRQDVIDKMNEQMGLYSPYANIFVPYYQQMYHDGFNELPADEAAALLNVAYEDIEEAFIYYMENLNNGRYFILMGHSQGAGILVDLLRKKFEDTYYSEKMLAAYTTGVSIMPIDTVDYPWIKIAQSSTDIGVVITYNTLASGYYKSSSFQTDALCVNPLLWTTDTTYAPQSKNLGAVWTDSEGNITDEIENFTDAQIRSDGALVVTTPNPYDYYDEDRQPLGAYHDYDQVFFYRNLQQNVRDRIDAFNIINKK